MRASILVEFEHWGWGPATQAGLSNGHTQHGIYTFDIKVYYYIGITRTPDIKLKDALPFLH